MKTLIASLTVCLVLLGAYAYAATKPVQYPQEDQTNFGQLGLSGSSQNGNPGYISLSAPNSGDVNQTYYLWVDGVGNLRIASYPTISAYSSFPSGNWNTAGSTMGGTKVGSQ